MSILLVILFIIDCKSLEQLHNNVIENALVSIHFLLLTYVLILEASIINRYADITDHLWLQSMFAINTMSFHITTMHCSQRFHIQF